MVDLFAYPGFYSNPDLLPTRARDWEVGWRYLKDGWRFKVTAFDMTLTDEVVFVLTDPGLFIGQNQNVGRSYRRGVEAEGHVPLPAGFSLLRHGVLPGERSHHGRPLRREGVPMVPESRAPAGAQWNDADWTVRLAALRVGPQRLDSDLTNARPGLPGYATVDLSPATSGGDSRWRPRSQPAGPELRHAGASPTGYQDYFTPAYP